MSTALPALSGSWAVIACVPGCPQVEAVRAGVCLLMYDVEPLKPSNTGWLIADVVADTFRLRLGAHRGRPRPCWRCWPIRSGSRMWCFPGEFVEPGRVVTQVGSTEPTGKRPLFILLDATWPEARKMFRKSPYLDQLPVLSLQPEQLSRYRLRRSKRDDHLCTAEVASLCLELAGEAHAAQTLDAYLDVFTNHYLNAKHQRPIDFDDADHQRLRALR